MCMCSRFSLFTNSMFEITYLLKFICNLKINTHGTFMVFPEHINHKKQFKSPAAQVPSWEWIRQCSFSFSSQTLNMYSLHSLLSASFCFCFHFLCMWLVISLLKMASSAEVFSSIPNRKEAVMCLTCIRQDSFRHEL